MTAWPAGAEAWRRHAEAIRAQAPAAGTNWQTHSYNVQMSIEDAPAEEPPMSQEEEEERLF